MEELTCRTEKIIYRHPESGWSVISCFLRDNRKIRITGDLPDVQEGMTVILQGEWYEDERYGRQFRVRNYRQTERTRRPWLERDLFERLSGSPFRMRFHLKAADIAYIDERGAEVIRRHAEEIIRKRLAEAEPANDGKQTPMRSAPKGHPVFIAQHATATCCRGCLEKWHGIAKGKALDEAEIRYITDVIMRWIGKEYTAYKQQER